jgi:hypothetical protein
MTNLDRGSTLGLLIFCRNDVEGVVRNVRTLRPSIDEVVVVDSSRPAQRAELVEALRLPGGRLCPAPPLGNIDLLRPFGLAQMTSDRVLQLDADEVASPALIARLPELVGSEAYVLPRWEGGARGYTYHLRLFQRGRARYDGPSYGFPIIEGRTEVLARKFHILHAAAGGGDYWTEGDRVQRYLPSDLLERPYDARYFRRTIRGESAPTAPGPAVPPSDPPLSEAAIRLALCLEAGRTLLTTGSLGLARMRLEHGRQRRIYWERLTTEERRWFTDAAGKVRYAGGLVAFLGLDDVEYVARLGRVFGSEVDGPALLRFLLHERTRIGRPWDDSNAPPEFGQGTVRAPA